MKQNLKQKLPQWHHDLSNNKLILTDDIDSLLSCTILNKLFNCDIAAFYDFNSLYYNQKPLKLPDLIGVDMDAFGNLKCFGNHESYCYTNKNSVNLNNIFRNPDKYNYYDKYNLSTVLLIISVYNVNIEILTDEQLLALMAIDSAFKGYYVSKFKDIYLKWLKRLDLKFLEERILQKYDTDIFNKINEKYNLKGKILLNLETKKLETTINLEALSKLLQLNITLPDATFFKVKDFKQKTIFPGLEVMPQQKDIFTLSRTRGTVVKMSTINKIKQSQYQKFNEDIHLKPLQSKHYMQLQSNKIKTRKDIIYHGNSNKQSNESKNNKLYNKTYNKKNRTTKKRCNIQLCNRKKTHTKRI